MYYEPPKKIGIVHPVGWIGILLIVSTFGVIQRPPVLPVNLTYLGTAAVFYLTLLYIFARGITLSLEWTRYDIYVLAIIASAFISSSIAYYYYKMPFTILEKSRLAFIGMMVFYFLIRMVVNKPRYIRFLLIMLILGILIQNIAGTILFSFRGDLNVLKIMGAEIAFTDEASFYYSSRLTSFFDNPNMYASLPLIAIPISLGLYFSLTGRLIRAICLSNFFLSLITVTLTFSRSAWLGAGASLLFLVIFPEFRTRINRIKGVTVVVSALLAFALFAGVSHYEIAVKERYFSFFRSKSMGYRLEMWQHSLEIIKDYPAGVGFGNYRQVSSEIDSKQWYIAGTSGHNSFVTIATEGSLICGGSLFLFFTGIIRVPFRRKPNIENKILLISIGAGILAMMVHMFFHSVHNQIFIWVLCACQVSLLQVSGK